MLKPKTVVEVDGCIPYIQGQEPHKFMTNKLRKQGYFVAFCKDNSEQQSIWLIAYWNNLKKHNIQNPAYAMHEFIEFLLKYVRIFFRYNEDIGTHTYQDWDFGLSISNTQKQTGIVYDTFIEQIKNQYLWTLEHPEAQDKTINIWIEFKKFDFEVLYRGHKTEIYLQSFMEIIMHTAVPKNFHKKLLKMTMELVSVLFENKEVVNPEMFGMKKVTKTWDFVELEDTFFILAYQLFLLYLAHKDTILLGKRVDRKWLIGTYLHLPFAETIFCNQQPMVNYFGWGWYIHAKIFNKIKHKYELANGMYHYEKAFYEVSKTIKKLKQANSSFKKYYPKSFKIYNIIQPSFERIH
jgi:hypothetical protein